MRTRSTLIDTLKILASQLIVLHHLSVYSPMAKVLGVSNPSLLGVLGDEGRLVVQCFLVIAGFLAAQGSLSGRQLSLPQAIWGRYLRLAPQFAVALLVLLLVMALVAPFYQPECAVAITLGTHGPCADAARPVGRACAVSRCLVCGD